ncbi:MAG: hypothetical protein ACTSQI_16110 [Candidatus Helarchaeota archaeon]
MVRPIKYLVVRKYEDVTKSDLSKLPLDAISGIVKDDIPGFEEQGIKTIPELAEAKFSKLQGKNLSDYKLNRGISYAIDIMIQVEEPGVHDEIMPIDELLDKEYEQTPPTELANLSTVAIEGVAPGSEKKLKKKNIKTVKELAEADVDTVKKAGLKDWEAEKFIQFAKWIMEYAEVSEKNYFDNIEWELKDNLLILKIDITKELGKSRSGKTTIVANTHGARRLKGTDMKLNGFAYKYPTEKKVKALKQREMQNIDSSVEGNIMTLTIDTTKEFGTSASGKNVIVATSRGNKQIEPTKIFVGINLYKPKA